MPDIMAFLLAEYYPALKCLCSTEPATEFGPCQTRKQS